MREFLAIDSCLDAGHVYDYAELRCDTTASVLPVTSPKQDVMLGLIAAAFVLMSLGVAWVSQAAAGRVRAISFSGLMALLIMGLAIWAVPGWAKLVLVAPVIVGAGWAIYNIRRTGTSA